jgi:1-deoxy-D-xylulose-5-phosphate synthase
MEFAQQRSVGAGTDYACVVDELTGGEGVASGVSVLHRVDEPGVLGGLSDEELTRLSVEIRDFLVRKVAVTGGHLGSNLGVVELTIALHRVFDSPKDALLFDIGHQAYVHKILTGRRAGFDELRCRGGLSGYPSRAESEHDWVESSHASSALSYADGLAKAFALTGQRDRCVVAVVGDGALTGGMCWEALNNIAAGKRRSLIVVVNDNGRSYAPTVGGLADRLSVLRVAAECERTVDLVKQFVLKDSFGSLALFGDLGIDYIGPIDGHDRVAVEVALRGAKAVGGPVIVHVVTRKGMGYEPAENDMADRMHGPGPFDPQTGQVRGLVASAVSWTSVFSDELVRHGGDRGDIVAITAAMAGPTGLVAFGRRFPDRMFDVGMAEQHAVTSAAGLALGGLHPVVALYSTFLSRAFDQLLLDVALLRLPVTFVLDRSGITGPDGASHNGMWDLSLLGIVPGIRVAAPRDAATLRAELAEALGYGDGPSVIRFPKGSVGPDIAAVECIDGVDLLRCCDGVGEVLLVAVGPFAGIAVEAADILLRLGVQVMVVDPRWVLPVSESLIKLADSARLVVTVEDNGLHGGFGSVLAARLGAAGVDVSIRSLGVPQQFVAQASRSQVLSALGLTAAGVARSISGWLAEPADTDGIRKG